MKALESYAKLKSKPSWHVAALLVCAASVLAASEPAYIQSQGNQFLIGNQYLQRTITVQDGHPFTSQFENKISQRTYQISGKEFQLELVWERLNYFQGFENPWVLDATSFTNDGTRVQDLAGGTKQLIFSLTNQERAPTLHVQMIYEIRPGEPFTRQWLELKTEGTGSLFLHYAAVHRSRWHGSQLRLGGFGQPIYSEDLFWGLEYPSSINRFEGEELSLGSYVGLKVSANGLKTEPAVIGVAAPGQVQPAFFDYINSVRAQPVRPYVLYNTWYDLQGEAMTAQNTRQRVGELGSLLQDKYKLKLDSFVLDDGWDNKKTLWRIDSSRFPKGFEDLSASLKNIGSGLGIWYGPVGGYDDRSVRIASGRSLGMEVQSNSDYLCLAGRHYSEYFNKSVLDMQKQYDIDYFKLDGIPFGCNEPDHGHPAGIYSREADERVFVDLLTKLRRQKPDVFLNITTGIWLSPWWLRYADTVWMGGEDSGYLSSLPTLSPRQSALSYRDSVLYEDFVRNQSQFPLSSIMTHGIIRGRYNLLGGSRESLADWRDEIVHYYSVGNMMTELYITPELLNQQEWDDLAFTLHWAEANQHPLLDNSRMILGDPARREPYGFVHSSPNKVIVTLRNPFAQPQTVHLPLQESTGFRKSEKAYHAKTIYPFQADDSISYVFGDTIHTELQGFEQRVLELSTDPSLVVTGARYFAQDKGNGTAILHLFAPGGSKRIIMVDGQSHELQFGKHAQAESSILAAASVHGDSVDLDLQIPGDVPKTTVALLFEPEGKIAEISATATDNGDSVALTTEKGQGVWQWFSLALKPGTHKVRITLNLPALLQRGGNVSVWAVAEKQLIETTLPISSSGKKITPPAESLPLENRVEKTTLKLLESTMRAALGSPSRTPQ